MTPGVDDIFLNATLCFPNSLKQSESSKQPKLGSKFGNWPKFAAGKVFPHFQPTIFSRSEKIP